MTRGVVDPTRGFDSRRVSPSRVNALVSCGIAFRMKYLENLPEEVSGSAALFGSVVHLALERWALDRDQDLLPLMRQAWLDFCGERSEKLKEFIEEYAGISTEVLWAEHAAAESFTRRNKGKESKAPRMTKEFKESEACKKLNRLLARWIPVLEKHSPYRFTERDPLPGLYDESLKLAKRYEKRWRHLPPALYVEQGFEIPWRGFTLHGYIDTIELLLHPETAELQGIGVIDYKTYAKEPAEFKDWRQTVIYDVAVRHLISTGHLSLPPDVPVYIGVDYVRLQLRHFWEVAQEDYERLERELNAYANTVEGGNFLPAEKGRNPDYCGYPSSCCLRSTAAAGGSSLPVEVIL